MHKQHVGRDVFTFGVEFDAISGTIYTTLWRDFAAKMQDGDPTLFIFHQYFSNGKAHLTDHEKLVVAWFVGRPVWMSCWSLERTNAAFATFRFNLADLRELLGKLNSAGLSNFTGFSELVSLYTAALDSACVKSTRIYSGHRLDSTWTLYRTYPRTYGELPSEDIDFGLFSAGKLGSLEGTQGW